MKKLLLLLPICLVFGCKFSEKIRDGQTAFERKQYHEAARLYEKEFDKKKPIEQTKIAFQIAQSYRQFNEHEQAAEWFKKAIDLNYGPKAIYHYALTTKQLGDYETAIKAFKKYGQEAGEVPEMRQEITTCELAQQWLQEAPKNAFQIEQQTYNSTYSDYAPAFFEAQQIIFTSDRATANGDAEYKWTGKQFSDLFKVDTSGNISSFEAFNSEFNEGSICFNSTFSTAYFTRCGSPEKSGVDYCKIFFSKKNKDGVWTQPKVCDFVVAGANYAHPHLADDDKTLYFSSDINGFGGVDIFKIVRTADGWSLPNNLGDAVNTKGDEKFPFRQNDTLYFASDGHAGMGGLDIFKVTKQRGTWRNTVNLRAPINSNGDDFGLIIRDLATKEGFTHEGYFSSTRKDGMGKDDIYYFTKKYIAPPKEDSLPPPPIDSIPPKPAVVYEFILKGQVLVKNYENDSPESLVLDSLPAIGASVGINTDTTFATLITDENGRFEMTLKEETDYFFLAALSGFLNNSAQLTTRQRKDEKQPKQQFDVTIVLDKIFKNQEITLENIYYDYDKWDIRTDAEPSLNALVKILNENPEISIQLASHTDCRGDEAYNKRLSTKRAESAVNYLIERGISPSRLVAQGYGEERPTNDCLCKKCTEEEHQANRRTTFSIQ